MRSRQWYDKHRYRLSRGIPEVDYSKAFFMELLESQWSINFEKLMRNRLVMGAIRYGKINQYNKPVYDRCNSIRTRLESYEDSGNIELLVDIANLALLEFEEGNHPNKHFKPIDDGDHVKIK